VHHSYQDSGYVNMFKCPDCSKVYCYKHTLKRHVKEKHTAEYECYMCDEHFSQKNALNNHLKAKHDVVLHDYEYQDTATKAPPLQRTLATEIHDETLVPSYSQWNEEPHDLFKGVHSSSRTSPYQFKHPFCMMVAGPSRSGKTFWVTKLLMTKDKRIHPTPDRIVYCYRHWQKLYNKLRMHDPAIRWHNGLPTTVLMEKMTDTIVVIDDLMEAGMNNPLLMSTEGSHHKNISVIFIVQNLLHQGKRS
jgi:hypothetical protein